MRAVPVVAQLSAAGEADPSLPLLREERAAAAQGRAAFNVKRSVTPAPRRVVVRKAPVVRKAVVAKQVAVRRVPVERVETDEQRGQRVLASLHYPWQRLGYRIAFLPDKHGYLGLTTPGPNLIQIYVRRSESDLVLSHSIAHELGHALDFSRGSAATRALYLSIRGLPATLTWFGCSGCTDYQTPAGDWAEVFASWLAGPGDFRSMVAGPPGAAQRAALSPLFQL